MALTKQQYRKVQGDLLSKHGFSLQDAAEHCGVSRTQLRRIIHGESASKEATRPKLVALLGYDPAERFTDNGSSTEAAHAGG